MAGAVVEARPSLIGSTICGEKIEPRERIKEDGSRETVSPIFMTGKELVVKTTFFTAVFSLDGKRSLEGPAIMKDKFSAQSTFALFKAGDELGVKITSEKPRKERLFVEVDGNNVNYRLGGHPNVIFTNNGEKGRLGDPYIKIIPTLIPKLGGELGDEIRKEHKNASEMYLAVAKKLQEKNPDKGYAEGSGADVGMNFMKEKIFVKMDANGRISEFGRVDQKDRFSFYITDNGGVGVMIKPQDIKNLTRELGDTETGVGVGMAYGNIPYYLPKVQYFITELERLSGHREVVEFIESGGKPPFPKQTLA
ncbi:MAG: hypothetical protein QXF56_04260 [Candidatus Micrarchaeia archaeon]